MSAKPTVVPLWGTGSPIITTPPSGKQTTGWVTGDIAVDGWLNYLFVPTTQWAKFWDERISGSSAVDLALITAATGNITLTPGAGGNIQLAGTINGASGGGVAVTALGVGAFAGVLGTGGATGDGVRGVGGSTSGNGIGGRDHAVSQSLYDSSSSFISAAGVVGVGSQVGVVGIVGAASNNTSIGVLGMGNAGGFSGVGGGFSGASSAYADIIALISAHQGSGIITIGSSNTAGSAGIYSKHANANGTGIIGEHTGSGIAVNGKSSTGFGGQFSSGSGGGLFAFSTSGIALTLSQNTTRATISVGSVLSANPTGPNAVGDMFVFTGGILRICTAAGSPGTWVDVGTQT